MKKKIFIWCSDVQINNGEGVLGNKFINDLKKYNKNYIFKIKTLSLSNTKFFRNIFGSIADRFIFPYLGVLYLWFIFIFKNKQKICFVNYLPLWNFLLFILLPPKTILGPITGGSNYLKKPYINYILRKILLNFFCSLSIKIINFRHNKLLFSTDLLRNKFTKTKKNKYNYVFKDFIYSDKNLKRKFDIIFYLRSHENKNTLLLNNLAEHLSNYFKIITIGEKIKNKKIINKGYIDKKKLFEILQRTKYSIISGENNYSLFSLDCLSNGVHVFYNKQNSSLKNLRKNMTPLNYNKQDLILKILIKKIKKNVKKQDIITFKNNEYFRDYFKI